MYIYIYIYIYIYKVYTQYLTEVSTPLTFTLDVSTPLTLDRVWRQPGEVYKDKCVLPTVKHGGGSVMVWGCMSAAGTGELHFIEGTMNANMYCDILKQTGPQGSIST